MVGVGPQGDESMLARVSLVNQFGKCVYDKYVKPTQPVTDYRTAVSGIRPENLAQGGFPARLRGGGAPACFPPPPAMGPPPRAHGFCWLCARPTRLPRCLLAPQP